MKQTMQMRMQYDVGNLWEKEKYPKWGGEEKPLLMCPLIINFLFPERMADIN